MAFICGHRGSGRAVQKPRGMIAKTGPVGSVSRLMGIRHYVREVQEAAGVSNHGGNRESHERGGGRVQLWLRGNVRGRIGGPNN